MCCVNIAAYNELQLTAARMAARRASFVGGLLEKVVHVREQSTSRDLTCDGRLALLKAQLISKI